MEKSKSLSKNPNAVAVPPSHMFKELTSPPPDEEQSQGEKISSTHEYSLNFSENSLRLRNHSSDSIEILMDDNDLIVEDHTSNASLEDIEEDDDDDHHGKHALRSENLLADEMQSLVQNILPLSVSTKCEEEFDITARALKRAMTPKQELWNAVTMIFGPCFCIYFLLSGSWLTTDDIEKVRNSLVDSQETSTTIQDWSMISSFTNESKRNMCIHSTIFPYLYAIPPWTSLAVALGIAIHTPASINYHLYCAYKIPAGPLRLDHWSRRLDQAMMHFMSLCWSYGSSGHWDYTLAAMAFNLDSIYRLYRRPFRPRNVLMRFGIAIMIQTLPFLRAGFVLLCVKLFLIYATSAFIFSRYPFGGYSHGVFHLVMAIAPPLVIIASSKLPVVEDQIRFAALCAISIGK